MRKSIIDRKVTVTITGRQKLLESVISMLWEMYGVKVQATDIYLFEDQAHLCSSKTADIFRTSYHNFSNAYVPYLMIAGVHRIIAGRNKYYNIDAALDILSEAEKRGVTVSEVCDERHTKIKQKKRRK